MEALEDIAQNEPLTIDGGILEKADVTFHVGDFIIITDKLTEETIDGKVIFKTHIKGFQHEFSEGNFVNYKVTNIEDEDVGIYNAELLPVAGILREEYKKFEQIFISYLRGEYGFNKLRKTRDELDKFMKIVEDLRNMCNTPKANVRRKYKRKINDLYEETATLQDAINEQKDTRSIAKEIRRGFEEDSIAISGVWKDREVISDLVNHTYEALGSNFRMRNFGLVDIYDNAKVELRHKTTDEVYLTFALTPWVEFGDADEPIKQYTPTGTSEPISFPNPQIAYLGAHEDLLNPVARGHLLPEIYKIIEHNILGPMDLKGKELFYVSPSEEADKLIEGFGFNNIGTTEYKASKLNVFHKVLGQQ
jgi:hypothetical protein